MIDETHDPVLESWVAGANEAESDFPIQNLPFGVFRTRSQNSAPRVGVAIGNAILDASEWLAGQDLTAYMRLSGSDRKELRKRISRVLERGSRPRELALQRDCEMLLPVDVGDYTDFYASIHHATNVGKMFRPDNPLLPNYKHVPIAYHGRSSSIVVSGTAVRRPNGQLGEGNFGATRELDYEVELGAFLGPGNGLGEPIPVDQAEEHLVGICLLNDWSARDIQRWEYQPLGPFLAKNFATTISPWMITKEALEPFRANAVEHDVPVLKYLDQDGEPGFDITLEVWLRTHGMDGAVRVSKSNFRDMYWTLAQMIAHHTSNGCAVRAGDLIASGTVSGPEKSNCGCLLEMTWKGREPLVFANGEKRCFLEDGDEVILRGYCERDEFRRIGLGRCAGKVLPAKAG